MDYAMRLQDTILPSPALLEENISGHLIFYRPKQKVSGDFYWIEKIGEEITEVLEYTPGNMHVRKII